MDKDTFYRYRFITVYYELCEELTLGLDYKSYMVLNTMMLFSKGNSFEYGVQFIADYLCLCRNTVYKSLRKLQVKNHIEKKGNNYNLYKDIKEMFLFYQKKHTDRKTKENFYLRIYPLLLEVHFLSVNEAALLYLFYSYSLRWGKATALRTTYTKHIKIKEAQYFNIKRKLHHKELIVLHKQNTVVVSKGIVGLFKKYSIEKDV